MRVGFFVNKPIKNTDVAVIIEEMALSSPHWSGCKIVNITEWPEAMQLKENVHNANAIARKDNFNFDIITIN